MPEIEEDEGQLVQHGPCSCSCFAVPLKRRLETMAITFMILLFPGFLLLAGAALWYDLMWTRYIFLAATLWQLLVDGRAEKRGGRPLGWVQRLPLFDYVGDYFPSRMHIEEPLDPDHPHIISAHPHG
jgi:hypothetical protein